MDPLSSKLLKGMLQLHTVMVITNSIFHPMQIYIVAIVLDHMLISDNKVESLYHQ